MARRTAGSDNVKGTGGGKRGSIHGFSRHSHRRMVCLLQRIGWRGQGAFFVTLTYPDASRGQEWQESKTHLRLGRQRLQRRWGYRLKGGLWRLEVVPRKSGEHVGAMMPHYHVVLFWRDDFGPDLDAFREWVSRSWYETVNSGDAKHLQAGTQVVRARNRGGAETGKLLTYLSKYLGKIAPKMLIDKTSGEILQTGRIWGQFGDLPTVTIAALRMTYPAYCELCERVATLGRAVGSWYLGAITERWRGFAVLGDGLALLELFDGIDGVEFIASKPTLEG